LFELDTITGTGSLSFEVTSDGRRTAAVRICGLDA
jgi:hypothetical protein